MKNIYWFIIAIVACVLLSVYFSNDSCMGEGLPPKQLTNKTNWMKKYANKNIFKMYLPGTHNSSSYQVLYPESVKNFKGLAGKVFRQFTLTQEHDIYTQLQYGIRALDLRINTAVAGMPYTSHTAFTLSLREALDQVKRFLKENPTEVVVILFKEDWEFRLYKTNWEEVGTVFDDILGGMTVSEMSKDLPIGDLTRLGKQVILVNENNVDLKTKVDVWGGQLVDNRWYNTNEIAVLREKLIKDISKTEQPGKLNVTGPVVTPDMDKDILPALNPLVRKCKWVSTRGMARVANKMYMDLPSRAGNYKVRMMDFFTEDMLLDTIQLNDK